MATNPQAEHRLGEEEIPVNRAKVAFHRDEKPSFEHERSRELALRILFDALDLSVVEVKEISVLVEKRLDDITPASSQLFNFGLGHPCTAFRCTSTPNLRLVRNEAQAIGRETPS